MTPKSDLNPDPCLKSSLKQVDIDQKVTVSRGKPILGPKNELK